MVFEKNGQRLIVNDRAHIDCLKAKGWAEVVKQAATEKEVKANARKTPRRTE